eukprot:876400_1
MERTPRTILERTPVFDQVQIAMPMDCITLNDIIHAYARDPIKPLMIPSATQPETSVIDDVLLVIGHQILDITRVNVLYYTYKLLNKLHALMDDITFECL